MMKRILFAILAIITATPLFAQIEDDWEKELLDFEKFRDSVFNDFEEFRRKANEEFAEFLAEAWKPEPTQPAVEPPMKPKPVEPVIAPPRPSKPIGTDDPQGLKDPDKPDVPVSPTVPWERPEDDLVLFNGEPIKPQPIERPQPAEPIKLSPRADVPMATFRFFDTPMNFHFGKDRTLRLKDATEKSVSEMWKQLSDSYYDNVIAECLENSQKQNLSDWGYLLLTKKVAEEYCGAGTNESVVMHMYLLTQSGFQVRIGRANDKFSLMFASQSIIYKYKYFNLSGEKYYILDKSLAGLPFYVFDHAFPKEKSLSLAITQPKLNVVQTQERTVTSQRYPEVSVTIETNQNLIDFYNTYPLSSEWNTYSKASLSDVLKDDLYPVLKKAIKGKTEAAAANILLNFIQTGFEYKTDGQQFGYERPLFPDESFYYPYCDCEDRSILFSCFVRELMGLDVILLNYPDHLATAVHFNEDIPGDFLMVEGKRYLICDPTYIGAEIGRCMPQYKIIEPKVQTF